MGRISVSDGRQPNRRPVMIPSDPSFFCPCRCRSHLLILS